MIRGKKNKTRNRGAAALSGTQTGRLFGKQRTIGRKARHHQHHLSALFHAESGGATYFLTFAARPGVNFDRAERAIVLESVKWGHPELWELHGAVVMPDHVHMLLTPRGASVGASDSATRLRGASSDKRTPEDERWLSISEIVKGIKSVTARKINRRRGRDGSLWDDDYYERTVRDEDDFRVKMEYLERNPVKRGLAKNGSEWDGLWLGR